MVGDRSSFRQTKDSIHEAKVLGHLGFTHHNLKHYEQAIAFYEQALTVFRQTKNMELEKLMRQNINLANQRRAFSL
jgi:Tetratricopeptide repeat